MFEILLAVCGGFILGNFMGIFAALILSKDSVDWSRHECRTCGHMIDGMLSVTCGAKKGPRAGGRTDLTSTCDSWKPMEGKER